MSSFNRHGVILFIVITVIMTVAIISTIVLKIVANQARLNHHQISRIQSQYAAKAGVIYALDKLRRNDAADEPCISAGGWIMRKDNLSGEDCVVVEPNLSNSISEVVINVGAPGSGVSGTRKVSATANYVD